MNEPDTSTPRTCPNCGATFTGRYCSNCGQEDHSLAVPLHRMILDFLSDQFQFDSRIGRTLGLLLFRPGRLTRNYLAGQRQRYIPPVRMYLFLSIIFFLVVGLMPVKVQDVVHINEPGQGPAPATATQLAAVMATIRKGVARKQPPSAATDLGSTIKRRIAESAQTAAPAASASPGPMGRWFVARFKAAKANPGEFWRQFRGNMPKVLFFLIPVFALLLKVFYFLRKRYYSEHLIFALHYHSVLFLNLLLVVGLVALARIAPAVLGATARWAGVALGIWSVLYLVPAMKTAYGDGWWGAIWRSSILWFLYFLMLVFGTVGAVMVTLAMS